MRRLVITLIVVILGVLPLIAVDSSSSIETDRLKVRIDSIFNSVVYSSDPDISSDIVEICEVASEKTSEDYGSVIDYIYVKAETAGLDFVLPLIKQSVYDPSCQLSRRKHIQMRIKSVETIKIGVLAPKLEDLQLGKMEKEYQLRFFYSLECGHCKQFMERLSLWYSDPVNRGWLDVVTIAVEGEKRLYDYVSRTFPSDWQNFYLDKGFDHPDALAHYVVNPPVILLIDRDGVIQLMPFMMSDLANFFQ